MNPQKRDDFSKFIIHLCRNYNNTSAEDNLINILKMKSIEARNYHCLFNNLIKDSNFSQVLKNKFKTVCFTEIPLNQINKIVGFIPGRQIQLQPFGLIFWRENILNKGSNPAIYINGSGDLKKYLLNKFKDQFKGISLYKKLILIDSFYYEVIKYFSIINVIQKNHDFAWEREWRHNSNFDFKYHELVAIIAKEPQSFIKKCSRKLSPKNMDYINKIPIINPDWNYEEILESFAQSIWEYNS